MAYYLGRDLEIALTTENTGFGIIADEHGSDVGLQIAKVKDFAGSDGDFVGSTMRTKLFAGPKIQTSSSVFGTMTVNIGDPAADQTYDNTPDNITGCDISVSTTDEDVQFIGQRNVLKAEVKKENSVTLTRKKKDNVWNVAFDQARFGIAESGSGLADGQTQPDYTGYGYRVYLKFKTGAAGETFILPNCCVTDYTINLQTDGSQEETLTLLSYVNPVILTGEDSSDQLGAAVGGL